MTPEQYCQDKAAKSGSSFYYSFLILPAQQKRAIIALYAFCREVDDVVDECSDATIAAQKLQWWREEVQRAFQNQARHPVGKELQWLKEHFNIHQELLEEIMDGMEMDLHYTGYKTFADLSLYCYRVASVVGLLSVEIFGYENRKTLDFARDLGMALQLTNIIRDLREDADRGRLYLPSEDMERFGVRPADFMQPKTSERMRKLLEFQAQRAFDYYDKALQALPAEDRLKQTSSLVMAKIYRQLLLEIQADGFKVLEQRISLTPIRKVLLAWGVLWSQRLFRWFGKH